MTQADKVHCEGTATEVHGLITATEVDVADSATHGGRHRIHESGSVR